MRKRNSRILIDEEKNLWEIVSPEIFNFFFSNKLDKKNSAVYKLSIMKFLYSLADNSPVPTSAFGPVLIITGVVDRG